MLGKQFAISLVPGGATIFLSSAMSETKMKRGDWVSQIADKVWQDPEFKKRLLANPAEVVSQETGTPIPRGMTIHVLEEDSKNVYLVIPKNPGKAEVLSDEELDSVAGGDGVQWPPCNTPGVTVCSSCIGTW